MDWQSVISSKQLVWELALSYLATDIWRKDLILPTNRVSSLEVNYGFKKMGRLGLWSSSDKSLACLATAKARSLGKHFIFMLRVIRREKSFFFFFLQMKWC